MGVERLHLKKGLKVVVQGFIDIDGETKMVNAPAVVLETPSHLINSIIKIEIVGGPYKGTVTSVHPEKLSWRKQ